MKTWKKLNYFTAAFLIAGFCVTGISCSGWPGKQPGKIKAKIRIVDIAPNDLGQVMIFGDSDGARTVFVRNFYQPDKNQGAIHAEISKYVDSLEKLKGTVVTITYRKDDIGDLEVLDIR